MQAKLRVFIADDHIVLRDGLAMLLSAQDDMDVVGTAADGQSALGQIAQQQPDIIIMDIAMPIMNGLALTEHIKQQYPEMKIVVLTRYKEAGYVERLGQAGVHGYVLKQAAANELLTAIRTVAMGGLYFDPAMMGQIVQSLLTDQDSDPSSWGKAALSERETQVLRLIAQGYSNKEIAAQLQLSIKTVDTYKQRAMEKLDLGSRVDLVRYAIKHGWLDTL